MILTMIENETDYYTLLFILLLFDSIFIFGTSVFIEIKAFPRLFIRSFQFL